MQTNDKKDFKPVKCRHWHDCKISDGGCCNKGIYQQPSHGICLNICNQYDGPDRGLGDSVQRVIHKLSAGRIKPCGKCRKRQNKLNQLLPYHGD
ncbi:MAG TPA: hypothetical protein DER01_08050 [Phycisphaerales bacterium]|nr:hypothetical protein [Phycisphaerales bacterium]